MKTNVASGDDDLPLTASGRVDGRSARKVETKRRIVQAAGELFSEQGFAGTSMDEIAEAAGVSKGTIFYNFKNKSELFEQLVHHAAQDIADEINAARQGREGWDSLVEAMWRVMELVDRSPASSRIIITELFRTHRPWKDSLAQARAELIAPVNEIMQELGERREAAEGRKMLRQAQYDQVSVTLLGALIVAALDHRAYPENRSLREVHSTLVQTIESIKI